MTGQCRIDFCRGPSKYLCVNGEPLRIRGQVLQLFCFAHNLVFIDSKEYLRFYQAPVAALQDFRTRVELEHRNGGQR